MSRVWVISDTHFGHKNIIQYTGRPFSSVEEMDNTMIENWNKVVAPEDTVYHLGDFILSKKHNIKEIARVLHGDKILIFGNHDKQSSQFYRNIFKEVYANPIIFKEFYMLSHYPVYLNKNMPYVNIHGHIHEKVMVCQSEGKNLYFNACVEHLNYTPILFDDIEKIYKVD
jgi:calcineurin-like phosphoesterase family protein